MGKIRNNKYDQNSFMLKSIIIFLLLTLSILTFSEVVVQSQIDDLESIIYSRSLRLESLFPEITVIRYDKPVAIEVKYMEQIISRLTLDKAGDFTAEKIVSFFLNVEENLLIISSIKNTNSKKSTVVDVIDAVYEYPFIDENGEYLVYISDKMTGNRNPVILNLMNHHERHVIIPESGDYFPLLFEDTLFFLMAVEDGFSIVSHDLSNGHYSELIRGDLTCLRSNHDFLYYSENNKVFQLNTSGHIINQFEFKYPIQSFDIAGNNLILSLLDGVQYDLFLFNIVGSKLIRLTDTEYNEVDVIFQNLTNAIFSSNKTGNYGIYQLNVSFVDSPSDYHLIYETKNKDIFYPCYSFVYSKIVSCVFETGKEPKFLIIPH